MKKLLPFVAILSMPWLASASPRLVVSTPSLTPESEIEVILDAPVVATTDLGKTVDNQMVRIDPPWPGKLFWKSQNVARYVPSQPPVIGATYTFSISSNQRHLDQSAIPAGKFATTQSESFHLTSANLQDRWSEDYSPSSGEWILAFNDSVDPATASKYISFTSKSGIRVAAKVSQSTVEEAGYYAGQSQPWVSRFPGAAPGKPLLPQSPAPCILKVRPATGLPPDIEWQIIITKGLPNLAANAKLPAESHYDIGKIDPFQVTGIEAVTEVDQPREIVISFNHPLLESLPVDFLIKCLEITPRPENLAAKFETKSIHLTGDLTEADRYTVTFRPPFPSRAGLDLAGPLTKEITFKHLTPELVLISHDEGQLATGSRKYRIQTINLSKLHLRVKRLSGENLIRAYQGYGNYTGRNKGTDGAPLPYTMVGGETIRDQEISLDNEIDTSKEVTLSWDEILKGQRYGTLFVDFTGTANSKTESNRKGIAQAIIQLTDIGLAWKMTGKSALVYAFSCETGAPLPGVKIDLFAEDASLLQTFTTDGSGIATLPRPENARELRASLGEDAYITSFDSSLLNVGMWHFPVRYSWSKPAGPARMAFLFTDRTLYRPGETVRLKGVVRSRDGNAIQLDKSAPARIVVVDPADKEIHTSPVTLSDTGDFDFTYTLSAGKTGPHLIRLEYPEDLKLAESLEDEWERQESLQENGRFEIPLRVEDFRRNAFELTQKIATPEIGATTLSAALTAKYYQGQPVAAGSVKTFSRVTAENPYPERFRDFLFGNHREPDWQYWYHYFGYKDDDSDNEGGAMTQSQSESHLDANGASNLAVNIPQADFPTTRTVMISTEVTDANQQTLTTTTQATVHPASVYVGVSRIDSLVRIGESLPLKLVATGIDGEPYAGAVKVTATLTREVNSAVKSLTPAGTNTRNDVTEQTVFTSEITIDPAASKKEGTAFSVTPKSNGVHYLTLHGKDPQGRLFSTVVRFMVYGSEEYPWHYEDGLRVKLVPEKKSYKAGETARVLVLSPIEGTALVTVEREKVLRSFEVALKADHPVIEIPITEDDAPNAYVSVLIVKGAKESAREHKEPQLRLGYCELLVENQRDLLAVKLDASPASVRPGDEVTISGQVLLADGTPAGGAGVTFYAEDEGTLAVMGYDTPSPMDYFYKPRNLDVETGTSFQTFISEDPESQSFTNKGFFVGGGGDFSKLADLLRKNFDPCAVWAPALVAGPDGRFTSTFEVPDTLTRYRLIAVAHHDAARFGHAEGELVVKKDLMLEPKAPRFANQGDTFDVQVLIQNASDLAGTWEIRYSTATGPETPCATVLGAPTATVSLAAGESTTVVFPTRAESTGEAILTWQATPLSLVNARLDDASSHRLSDAVETRFKIQYPMPLLRQSRSVSLTKPGATLDLLDQLDGRLLNGSGTIDLEISRSPLVEAAGSVEYLLHYPYGCVEQTTSSLIPWLAVEPLRSVIPKFAEIPDEKISKAIQAGADRLLSMQLPDGSFSYWPGSTESAKWATAYAGLGLMMAADHGANVPDSAKESLVKWLTESLRGIAAETSPSALEMHTRTLWVLSVAGSPQPAYQNILVDRLKELTPAARSLLACSIAAADAEDEELLARAKSILTSKVPNPESPDSWMPWSADDAYRLIAWNTVDPVGNETAKSLDRMLRDRNPYGHWRTTWVNGWSLMAMAFYAESHAITDESVKLNLTTPQGISRVQLTGETSAVSRSVPLTSEMKLTASADHAAFIRVNVSSKPKLAPVQPVATNGLSIERFYELVHGDGTTTVLTEPKVGDLIRVSLRVTLPKDDTRYLAIEDPLPSIFETVNNDFKSQKAAVGTTTSETDWQVSHSELRTDRAVFFLDHVWHKGTYTVTYLARCTIAGQAVAPSAKVESMYDPENFALTASRDFVGR